LFETSRSGVTPTGAWRIKAVGASVGPDGRRAPVPPNWKTRNDLESGANFPKRPHIQEGDQSLLYAVGDGLFAIVMHIGAPYEDHRLDDRFGPRWTWRMDHVIERYVPSLYQALPLDRIKPSPQRGHDLSLSIRQKSHFRLFPEEIAQIEALTASWETP
jgi:hypothetical protein